MWEKFRTRAKAVPIRYILAALAIIAGILYLRFAPESLKPWSNRPAPATPGQEPREIVRVERVVVRGPERIRVIEKIKYVEKLPGVLSPTTASDNGAQVIASAVIPPWPGKTIVSAILRSGPDNVAYGLIEYKQQPLPFFAVQKEFGVRAGMGTGGLVLGELYARPARVGPVTVEVRAFGKRDDRSGADFGAAALVDWRF
jgi:hypothetical protein